MFLLVAFATFVLTTLSGFAADRNSPKKRLTFHEKKREAEKEAARDAERDRRAKVMETLYPSDDTLVNILHETDASFQEEVRVALEAVASRSSDKEKAVLLASTFKKYESNSYFIMKFKDSGELTGKPISEVHEKFPSEPETGKPALLKVLLQSVYTEYPVNPKDSPKRDIKYFVAYLPDNMEFDKVKFLTISVHERIGVYLTPTDLNAQDMSEFCYAHLPFPGGRDDNGYGLWFPTAEKRRDYHSKTVKSPVATVSAALPVTPTAPSPLIKPRRP